MKFKLIADGEFHAKDMDDALRRLSHNFNNYRLEGVFIFPILESGNISLGEVKTPVAPKAKE
jgi:phosphotransacetylase